jgi:Tol biopolymer transport system component
MNMRSTSRRWRLLGATAMTISVIGASQVIAALADDAAPVPVPADTAATTPVIPLVSQTPSVSGDGQYVVYAGKPLDPSDPRASTVFLKNRANGSVGELTAPADGVLPGDSVLPVISADGCTIAVITQMSYDLFRDDNTGDRWDVYVNTLPVCAGGKLGDWQLVSTTRDSGFDAGAADDVSPIYPPAVSGDGTIIAYTQRFSVAAPDITGITVVDLTVPMGETGRAVAVAGQPAAPPDSTFRYRGLREPAISTDGMVVAFTSDAASSSALGDWGQGLEPGGFASSQVFVWDRANPDRNTNVRNISAPAATDPGEAASPALSGDGSTVAFVSTATSLTPGATLPPCTPTCVPEVYLYHRADATLKLASRVGGDPADAAIAANSAATQPALNSTGDELLYVTRATNLFPTRNSGLGGPDDGDIVLTVPSTGLVRRASVDTDGVSAAPAVNSHPHMSANGRVVVFDTLAGATFGADVVEGRQVVAIAQQPLLEMADLDMGTVAVGFPGPEWYLTVTNLGPGSFVPATVTVDSPDFLISGGSCVDQHGVAVPPGGSCSVNLMLLPTVAGIRGATLTVAEDGFGAVTVSSSLAGVGGEPALAATPGGVEAAPLVVGEHSAPAVFSVENVAFNPVHLQRVTIAGTDPTDYSLGADECSGRTLDAGAACTVEVIFQPTAAGRRTASVVVDTVEGAYTTMLISGVAHYEPKLAVTSNTIVAPSRQAVIGTGFAPNTKVTVAWADGRGRSFGGTTNAEGTLLAGFIVRATDRPGNRTLVAQTSDGQLATVDVLVVSPRGPGGPNSPRWPIPRRP